MSKLRKSARNQPCMIRIPYVCNHDESTTVLAHIGGGGMGLKRDDMEASFSCSACHSAVDGAVKSVYSPTELKLMHHEGAMRTRDWWRKLGYIGINGENIDKRLITH